MFAKWVSTGAIIGIEAFFALLVFFLWCVAFSWLIGKILWLLGNGNDERQEDDPR